MKIFPFFLLCLFISTMVGAQTGDKFPFMEGENLKNEMVNLPEDVKGKHTIIGLAYSKKAEDYLKNWFDPAYNQFISKPDANDVFKISYDVNVYFIPMFTGAKRPAYQKTMEKVKETIDNRLEPHILFYSGKLKEYETALKFDGKEIPYFYLLDEEGTIIYSTSGNYSDNKMQEIIDRLPF